MFDSISILSQESEHFECSKEKECELEKSESTKENECFIEKQESIEEITKRKRDDPLLNSGFMFDPSCHDFEFMNNSSINSIFGTNASFYYRLPSKDVDLDLLFEGMSKKLPRHLTLLRSSIQSNYKLPAIIDNGRRKEKGKIDLRMTVSSLPTISGSSLVEKGIISKATCQRQLAPHLLSPLCN
ncbi:hypothetical protein M9H77_07654 [Catharanthus roseus]|uniref:Uncharacterized protein n=1 Tax=Catharanthus roseus TaxID=4058 RepID=A0ACC0BVR6_CATRO|nr:hypothetical protein M9H77_07654 [Catharanthus roseus]